jgi:hypothetical protein
MQPTELPGQNLASQRGRPARIVLGRPKPDVVKLLQNRANWVSYGVLHCCSVDVGLLKVRLAPGSDRTADDSADPGCATSGHPDGVATSNRDNFPESLMTAKGPAGVTTSIRCYFAASCARMGSEAAASKLRNRGVSFDHFVGSREQCGRE